MSCIREGNYCDGQHPWFNIEIANAIRIRRRKEKRRRASQTEESRQEYVTARNEVNKLIIRRKCTYYRDKVVVAGTDAGKLYSLLSNLTGHKSKKKLLDGSSDPKLAYDFKDYFDKKIANIVNSFQGGLV